MMTEAGGNPWQEDTGNLNPGKAIVESEMMMKSAYERGVGSASLLSEPTLLSGRGSQAKKGMEGTTADFSAHSWPTG